MRRTITLTALALTPVVLVGCARGYMPSAEPGTLATNVLTQAGAGALIGAGAAALGCGFCGLIPAAAGAGLVTGVLSSYMYDMHQDAICADGPPNVICRLPVECLGLYTGAHLHEGQSVFYGHWHDEGQVHSGPYNGPRLNRTYCIGQVALANEGAIAGSSGARGDVRVDVDAPRIDVDAPDVDVDVDGDVPEVRTYDEGYEDGVEVETGDMDVDVDYEEGDVDYEEGDVDVDLTN